MAKQKRTLIQIMKNNWIDFLWIYPFVGVMPFLFGGFRFNQFGYSYWTLLVIVFGLGVTLFSLYVFIVYFIERFNSE